MALGQWINTFETKASNATTVDLTDDHRNEITVFTRERAKAEHDWGDSSFETGYTDTGRHVPGSARAFVATSTPTALRRPDNSGNQSGAASTLTGAKDAGRLWINTNTGNHRLQYYTSAGTWVDVRASGTPPTPVGATSPDATNIPNGSTITIGSWSTPLTITSPGASYRCHILASIALRNTSAADRYVRIDLNETTSLHAGTLVVKEQIVRTQISSTFNGVQWVDFYWAGIATTGTVFTFDFECESNNASGMDLGAGACDLVSAGAANLTHSCFIWMDSV